MRFLRKLTSITLPRAGAVLAGTVLIASCSGAPEPNRSSPDASASGREEVVAYAKTFLGTPYRSGGTTHKGVDCSGLVVSVYRNFEIALPRRSVDQSQVGEPVPRANLEAGDLVFFKTTRRYPVSHVGIYIGNGKFIHASTSARRVRIDELNSEYFRERFVVARRVIGS